MRTHMLRALTLPLLLLLLGACGDDEEKKPACDPVAQTGCGGGRVCEVVQGGGSVCADPVVLRGRVFDLADDAPIPGARIVALDVNRAPVSAVAISDEEGRYELTVPHVRDGNGQPIGMAVTLRADASGFQTFPAGIRQALPIDTGAATAEEDALVVESALTSIGLIALPDGAATGSIEGTIELPKDRRGVLVVAEHEGRGTSGIADRNGNFAIFNLPEGRYEVGAWTRGASFERAQVDVVAGESAHVDLALDDAPTGSITGKVSIVDPGDGRATSIVLVLESLFDEELLRGESPPGLRAPAPGVEPNVTGAFTIDGVPAGRYVVLAAFENDFLVRDPDTSIAGTSIVRETVEPGEDVTLAESFKITGALSFLPPLGVEPVAVSEAPTITWEDDSSEDAYEITVYDALGTTVVPTLTIPGVSGTNPSWTYSGPLDPGMYYQVKIRSMKAGVPIAQTEDLAGVFHVE